ncbi:unnamed protein product [Lota lota]
MTNINPEGTVEPERVPSSRAPDELADLEAEVGLPPNVKLNLTTEDDESFQDQEQMHPLTHCYQEMLEQHSSTFCGLKFVQSMEAIGAQHWCSFDHVIGPYNNLSLCMEQLCAVLGCYYPNPSVQDFFLHTHAKFFLHCSEEEDKLPGAPQAVVVALTLGPVTIIPLLVYLVSNRRDRVTIIPLLDYLVVWKSNRRDRVTIIPLLDFLVVWKSNRRDRVTTPGCQRGHQRVLCPGSPAVMTLSAVCGVLLLVCVALSMLYHKSENKPGREELLLDFQNLSDHHLITTKANRQLREQNQHLKQHNTWLIDQSTQLNQTSAGLTIKNRALTSAIVQLHVRQTNRTSTYEMLLRDHGQLLMYMADLENTNRNASQTISSLVLSHTELEAERLNFSDTNTFLREELIHANDEREELVELNSELGAQIQNLTARIAEEDAIRREDSEEQQQPEYEEAIIAELQERNPNLSALLGRNASEKESGDMGERESMLVDIRAKEEEYRSLDRYCPVVNRNTNERVCKTCPENWRLFQTTCYYFSSRALTWPASRSWCRTQGGDLLVVNTKQEQSFVVAASRRPEQTVARLWMGISDAEEEGRWLWVDGSPLSSDLQFWLKRPGTGTEPDDWRAENPQGEDCGHVDNNEEDLSSWMDGSCDLNYRWICEKRV